MSEHARELGELKHEVVEARNQAIKTDHQIKNLTFDVKGFEKRFDSLESRVRLSSIGVNLIVAVTIALSSYMVYAMRVRVFETEIASLKEAVRDEHLAARAKTDELAARVLEEDKRHQQGTKAAQMAVRILDLLDARQEKEATDLLDKLDVQHLSALERKVCERRFEDLRHRQAESLYRQARRAVADGHSDVAIPVFRRTLELEGEGRYAGQARYQLSWALWNTRRYGEVEPLARELSKNSDRTVADEARYMLATSLARLDHKDEATRLFGSIIAQESRFSGAARAYAAALEAGSELPQDLPNGRIRFARRLPGQGYIRQQSAHEPPAEGNAG
jgi:TolA-binding protein